LTVRLDTFDVRESTHRSITSGVTCDARVIPCDAHHVTHASSRVSCDRSVREV
jgi:hypothetical protein